VSTVAAGTGAITVTGTAANPVINNTGVTSVQAGTGIVITGTAASPSVNLSLPNQFDRYQSSAIITITNATNVTVYTSPNSLSFTYGRVYRLTLPYMYSYTSGGASSAATFVLKATTVQSGYTLTLFENWKYIASSTQTFSDSPSYVFSVPYTFSTPITLVLNATGITGTIIGNWISGANSVRLTGTGTAVVLEDLGPSF
jgi:hypothetical protein